MTSYETLWDFAEDHYGIITTAQAMAMGIDKHMLPAMAKRGTLIKKGHGVYLAKHHIPRENDVYAHSVAIVGKTAYLRSASVIALLKLAPTNPGVVYVGATARVRRRLPSGLRLVDMRPCDCVLYEGIRSQPLVEALKTARDEGAIEADRIADAAISAMEQGLISKTAAAEFTVV
jgi:hypothetical protein